MNATIFSDIDGVILEHRDPFHPMDNSGVDEAFFDDYFLFGEVIPATKKALFDLYDSGAKIILTTGRPQCQYEALRNYLSKHGIYFHKLIMECGSGIRVLINDKNPVGNIEKAHAVNVERNAGFNFFNGVIC